MRALRYNYPYFIKHLSHGKSLSGLLQTSPIRQLLVQHRHANEVEARNPTPSAFAKYPQAHRESDRVIWLERVAWPHLG